jgi:hypothetical protein
MVYVIDDVVGGLSKIETDVVVCGGKRVVVGGTVKYNMRGRAIKLKHVPRKDVRAVVAILGMSRPITFGHVEYDDGKRGKLGCARVVQPDDALHDQLEARLKMKPAAVIEQLVTDFELRTPVYLTMTDMIKMLLKYVRHRRPNMRAIKVSGDIGDILDRVARGDEFFKVATDNADWPASMPDVIVELLNILKRERVVRGKWVEPAMYNPVWPQLDKEVAKNMGAVGRVPRDTYKLVRAIVEREHHLLAHLESIGTYYTESARDVRALKMAVATFLNGKK